MNWGNFSPDSVLPAPPHLETILSGIEGEAEFQGTPETGSDKSSINEKKKKEKRKKLGMRGWSKSLSELEFEELKGFMDLGFVFSDEDKRDSALVEIIPGLQRLGKKRNGEEEEEEEEEKKIISGPHDVDEPASSAVVIKRPYLSESWEVLERRKKEEPLMNWKVPSVKNEIGMKDSLKWWAHTVASTVR